MGVARWVRVGPGGTSSARRSRCGISARPSTSTAVAATSSSRITSSAPPKRVRHGHVAFRAGLRAPGDGRLRRREDVEVARQPRLRLAAAPRRRRPDGDPARAARARARQRLGVVRRRDRRWRVAAVALARGVRRTSGAPAQPTVDRLRDELVDGLRTPEALHLVDQWAGTDGDDEQAPAQMAAAVDALLGVV